MKPSPEKKREVFRTVRFVSSPWINSSSTSKPPFIFFLPNADRSNWEFFRVVVVVMMLVSSWLEVTTSLLIRERERSEGWRKRKTMSARFIRGTRHGEKESHWGIFTVCANVKLTRGCWLLSNALEIKFKLNYFIFLRDIFNLIKIIKFR